jgi:hypothetical protein
VFHYLFFFRFVDEVENNFIQVCNQVVSGGSPPSSTKTSQYVGGGTEWEFGKIAKIGAKRISVVFVREARLQKKKSRPTMMRTL